MMVQLTPTLALSVAAPTIDSLVVSPLVSRGTVDQLFRVFGVNVTEGLTAVGLIRSMPLAMVLVV